MGKDQQHNIGTLWKEYVHTVEKQYKIKGSEILNKLETNSIQKAQSLTARKMSRSRKSDKCTITPYLHCYIILMVHITQPDCLQLE